MTTLQIITESLKTTLFGMGLVILTLYVLSIILQLSRIVFYPAASLKRAKISQIEASAEVKEENFVDEVIDGKTQSENLQDDSELIAIITAAVAAYLETSTINLKVNSIRQIHQKSPVWAVTSRIENTRSHIVHDIKKGEICK